MDNSQIKTTPKDVFLHLFNIITFYLTVIGFITLYIQYINVLFPDQLNYYFTGLAEATRVSSSILFIAVPAYLLSGWLLAKDLAAAPEKRELKMRRWLIYFTLFLAAITIVIDLIIFVYNFLNGELTIQFFLKVLTVLLVAGAVFAYYLWELKRRNLQAKTPRILAAAAAVVAAGSIILGFFIVGTPADQRERRFDERRVSDLQMLQDQIINYWSKKEILPENLNDLEAADINFSVPTDPGTGQPYEYQVSGALDFELCAVFSAVSEYNGLASKEIVSPYDPYGQRWEHQSGRQCWERKIDPDFYKSIKTVPAEAN